ncbi:hypothetical protein J2S00_000813 [Caldalkalibacillus uzonensis]|uniref:Lipoprotein n=1 Tax=Caldalkalibacillus uzonensis TaxID=353224 RepID=A0ABU0CNP4_9BACI|nr:hypothetical protein [Caldalkalibacillus uzonensis]MDQ0338030.1 hypothetical protein [Caldalkalibacillus uzonensis]
MFKKLFLVTALTSALLVGCADGEEAPMLEDQPEMNGPEEAPLNEPEEAPVNEPEESPLDDTKEDPFSETEDAPADEGFDEAEEDDEAVTE